MSNNNFAYPLAINGTKEQLAELVDQLTKIGYMKDSTSVYHPIGGPMLLTNFGGQSAIMGYCVNVGVFSGTRHVVSVSEHGFACILDLARARKEGNYAIGELVYWNSSLEMYRFQSHDTPEWWSGSRRPTFTEIINWHKYGSITEPEQPKEPAQAEPTLYGRIASGEVKQVWCKQWGVSKEIILRNLPAEYPIHVNFYVYSAQFTENGIHNIHWPTQTDCNITPVYTELAQAEPAQAEPITTKINSFRDEFMAGIQAATDQINSLEKIIDESDARIAELIAENKQLKDGYEAFAEKMEQAGKALQEALDKILKFNNYSL